MNIIMRKVKWSFANVSFEKEGEVGLMLSVSASDPRPTEWNNPKV